MNKLTALIEAAKSTVEPHKRYWERGRITGDDITLYHYYKVVNSPATILELCALLEKAEEALMWVNSCPRNFDRVHPTLVAIKQWKEPQPAALHETPKRDGVNAAGGTLSNPDEDDDKPRKVL